MSTAVGILSPSLEKENNFLLPASYPSGMLILVLLDLIIIAGINTGIGSSSGGKIRSIPLL